jgi:hypothetical protein
MPVTEADVMTLDWIASLGNRAVFFVINKWNILELMERTPAGQQKVEQRFRSKLKKYLPESTEAVFDRWVFKVNALAAAEARQSRPVDTRSLSSSGLPRFEEILERFLVERRIHARDRAVLAKASTVCRVASDQLQRMRHLSSQSLEQLNAKKAAIDPKLDQLRTIRRHISQFIEDQLVTTQKNMADRLNQHMSAVDTKQLVSKFDLEILDKWFAWQAAKDVARKARDKTVDAIAGVFGATIEHEDHTYPTQLRNSIEPQILAFIGTEFKVWEAKVANPEIRKEAAHIIGYLRDEAIDFKRVLDEIAQVIEDEPTAKDPINVDELVSDWVRERSTHGRPYGDIATGGLGGMALDLTPIVGGVLAEFALHIKGLGLPFIGTVLTLLFSLWRNDRTKERLLSGIKEGLHKAFAEIPIAQQREAIDKTLAEQFGRAADDEKPLSEVRYGEPPQEPLRRRILKNIDAQIESSQGELDDAILNVDRGAAQHTEKCAQCQMIEADLQRHMSALVVACGPASGQTHQALTASASASVRIT